MVIPIHYILKESIECHQHFCFLTVMEGDSSDPKAKHREYDKLDIDGKLIEAPEHCANAIKYVDEFAFTKDGDEILEKERKTILEKIGGIAVLAGRDFENFQGVYQGLVPHGQKEAPFPVVSEQMTQLTYFFAYIYDGGPNYSFPLANARAKDWHEKVPILPKHRTHPSDYLVTGSEFIRWLTSHQFE